MPTSKRFELDIDRRNLSAETLLADIMAVAKLLRTESPTTEQYEKHGQFSPSTIIKRFHGWKAALSAAGLKPVNNNGGTENAEALADLKRVSQLLDRHTVTTTEYGAHGHFASSVLARRFGSWNQALVAAGLNPSRRYRVPDDELFENLEYMWQSLGRQPKYMEVEKPLSRFSAGTYEARFGGWRKALEAFVLFANSEPPSDLGSRDIAAKENEISAAIPIQPKHVTSRTVNWRLRFLVMRRDGFRCRNCGASPAITPGVGLQADHILAWNKGGETVFKNLQTLCERCNIGKADLDAHAVP
jgi:5-methylcytosine-specific restriction endonuclease McrA